MTEGNEMQATEGKRKRGRPRGSKTRDLPVVEFEQLTCPVCGSSRRSKLETIGQKLEYPHTFNGTVYSVINWRATRCLECGQSYRVKVHANSEAGGTAIPGDMEE